MSQHVRVGPEAKKSRQEMALTKLADHLKDHKKSHSTGRTFTDAEWASHDKVQRSQYEAIKLKFGGT